jgi:6-pyruvoyltetrahydropterin/6-carboxytetrahydropterin synthase
MVAFGLLDEAYRNIFGNDLRLERVRLYETPNNWVDYVKPLVHMAFT